VGFARQLAEDATMTHITIRDATSKHDLDEVRCLFREYAASLDYGICFETFEKELESLPGRYAPPDGLLLLAEVDEEPAGCVALRPLGAGIGEMKRLYVRAEQRCFGLGRRLVEELLRRAKQIDCRAIRLDTLPEMQEAQRLYRTLGFREIPPYMAKPVPGATCMERVL
jgi:ribosomal protein S18 acetylase RimI-like enzyme